MSLPLTPDIQLRDFEAKARLLRTELELLEQSIAARRKGLVQHKLADFSGEMEATFRDDSLAAVLLDGDERIVQATGTFLRAFGLSDVIGVRLREAIAPQLSESTTPWESTGVGRGGDWDQRDVQTRDGRWFSRRSLPAFDHAGAAAGTIVTFTPIRNRGVLEERLKLAMQSARLGWWDWDFGTGTIAIYGGAECLLGYSVDTLPRSSAAWFDLTHPEDLADVRDLVENCLAGRIQEWTVEQRLRAWDGSWRWVLNSGKLAEFDSLGRATRMLGIVHDVHGRRSAEDNLRRDADILSQLHDAVVCMDRNGIVTYWNRAATQIFGSSADQVLGARYTDLCSTSEEKLAAERLVQRALSGEDVRGEQQQRRSNGDRFWLEFTVARFLDGKGNSAGVVAVFRDVTDRKIAEAELQRDARILAQLQDVVIYCRADYRIAYVNDAFEQVFGWPKASATGQAVTYRMPEHVHLEIQDYQRRVLAGEAFTIEWQDYRADGSRVWMRWRCQRMVDGDGNIIGVVNIGTDIDAIKRAEIEREQMQRQLIQAQRMDTLGSLAGGIAHDFNNILSAIYGFTEIALITTNPSEQSKHYHQQVLKAAERARELVKRILSFSRFHEPERRPLRLRDLIEDASKFIRAALPSSVELATKFDGECPPTLADSHQLHQVLMNLATNAAHAMGSARGSLVIGLRHQTIGDATQVATGKLRAGQYAIVTVTDTGHGMDAATQAKIFDPFFTTKKEGEGTGLGLSVVSAIMQGHNGGVDVKSEVGKGTTFTIYLPIVANVAVRAFAADDAFAPRMRARGETIAIIDDEEMVAATAEKVLQGLGYTTQSFPSAQKFLEFFSTAPTGVDLLLTDQTMPRLTGIELALQLRQEGHRFPILIMSGFSTQLQPAMIQQVGAAAVIKKPFERLELAQAVRSLLDGSNDRRN